MRRVTIGTAVFATALAGCSGASQPLPAAMPGMPATQLPARVRLAPDEKSAPTLYVTTSSATVLTYTWPGLYAGQTISGFDVPEALCTDARGNLYVPDLLRMEIYEYAPGGSTPTRTLTGNHGFAYSCAIDPTTGNLAVADVVAGDSGAPGNILIFKKARGKPTVHQAPNFRQYLYVTYDAAGNLFVDGRDPNGNSLLAELPKGAKSAEAISMKTPIGYPSGLQWDGEYLAEGDLNSNAIYQFKVNGTKAIQEGSTTLSGAGQIYQFAITGGTASHPQGTQIVVADYANNSIEVWSYPNAGYITSGISGLNGPIGVAIAK